MLLLLDHTNSSYFTAGDLLRAEQARPGSEFGEMISTYIREGNIVPMEVTIKVSSFETGSEWLFSKLIAVSVHVLSSFLKTL